MNAIVITAKTAAEASAIYADLRDKSGRGASTFPNGEWNGHRISYNGRVWASPEYRAGDECIYNPYA